MDSVDQITRSRIMASVKQRNTKPEMALRRSLHSMGLRYRLNDSSLPGSPDLVFPQFKAVIFVHGCYWHAHGCRFGTTPASRREFWLAKFEANRSRDRRNLERLNDLHWRTLVVWECRLKPYSAENTAQIAQQVKTWLLELQPSTEFG